MFLTIICIILSIVLLIGIYRVIVNPYNGFMNFLGELFLIDLLFEFLSIIIESWVDNHHS